MVLLKKRVQRRHGPHCLLLLLVLLMTACGGASSGAHAGTSPAASPSPQIPLTPTSLATNACPAQLQTVSDCLTPFSMRTAYGMETLIDQGMTGKGETVVDVVSFGSPTLQQDIDAFDRQFGLPPITIQVMAPIGSVKFDPANSDMVGWAEETTLDVEIIHAMAPDAGIVVLTSPVDETEGTIGLPEFLKLEQYADTHKLGQVFSQSYVASEPTLSDQKGRDLVTTFTNFYEQATTKDGWTIVSGSGDHGATDFNNVAATTFSSTPIVNFPADVPWVTSVGGTTLAHTAGTFAETAWSGSGGGVSTFFSQPDFQHGLPQSVQSVLNGQRGVPDVSANANPRTAMAIYFHGRWQQVGGTSAATPTWAGIIAVADQMAGHPLGFINPGLYKIAASDKAAQDFRDITSGDNTYDQDGVNVRGYTAKPGWDPITGCGAPIANKLLPDLITALKS